MTISVLVPTHCGKSSPHLHTHRPFFSLWRYTMGLAANLAGYLAPKFTLFDCHRQKRLGISTSSSRKSCAGILSVGCERCNQNITDKSHDSICLTTQTWHTLLRAKKLGRSSGPSAVVEGNDRVGEVGHVWMAVVELRESVNLLGTRPPKTVTADIGGSATSQPFKCRQGRKLLNQRC